MHPDRDAARATATPVPDASTGAAQLTRTPLSLAHVDRATRRYKLADLIAQCDLSAPPPLGLEQWDNMADFGREGWR
jgi:hypothetical protein